MKPIYFPCPGCGAKLSIESDKRRKVLVCAGCGQSICLGPGYIQKANLEQQREHAEARERLSRKRAEEARRAEEF